MSIAEVYDQKTFGPAPMDNSIYIADFSSCTEQPSDSWAIGATLAPVISGLYPWSIAKKREDFFAIFLSDPQYLCKKCGISESANDLLGGVSTIKPKREAHWLDFENKIISVDTFKFRTDEATSQAILDSQVRKMTGAADKILSLRRRFL